MSMLRRLPVRGALAVIASIALVGACGEDATVGLAVPTTTTEAGATTTTKRERSSPPTLTIVPPPPLDLDDVCLLLEPAELQLILGVPFEDQQPGRGSCVYTSSTGAETALNAVVSADPAKGLTGARGNCEPDTDLTLTVTGADGAFSCLVDGIPTVVGVARRALVVVTGRAAEEAVDANVFFTALVRLLELALAPD